MRGEIWLTNFDPTVGAEIKKSRPAVIISSNSVGKLPIKLVAPITDWKSSFEDNIWHVKVEPDSINNLSKTSAIDTLQLRGMDLKRFVRKIGNFSDITMSRISLVILTVIEAEI